MTEPYQREIEAFKNETFKSPYRLLLLLILPAPIPDNEKKLT